MAHASCTHVAFDRSQHYVADNPPRCAFPEEFAPNPLGHRTPSRPLRMSAADISGADNPSWAAVRLTPPFTWRNDVDWLGLFTGDFGVACVRRARAAPRGSS